MPTGRTCFDEEVLLQDQLFAFAWCAQPGEQVACAGSHVGPAGERVEMTLADRDPADHIGPRRSRSRPSTAPQSWPTTAMSRSSS